MKSPYAEILKELRTALRDQAHEWGGMCPSQEAAGYSNGLREAIRIVSRLRRKGKR